MKTYKEMAQDLIRRRNLLFIKSISRDPVSPFTVWFSFVGIMMIFTLLAVRTTL